MSTTPRTRASGKPASQPGGPREQPATPQRAAPGRAPGLHCEAAECVAAPRPSYHLPLWLARGPAATFAPLTACFSTARRTRSYLMWSRSCLSGASSRQGTARASRHVPSQALCGTAASTAALHSVPCGQAHTTSSRLVAHLLSLSAPPAGSTLCQRPGVQAAL